MVYRGARDRDALAAALESAAQVPIFSVLPREQLERFLCARPPLHLAPGETLFQQHDLAECFWFVDQGRVKLHVLSADGAEKLVEVIPSGQTFAEAVMFMERTRYPVTATALEASTLLAVDNQSFREYLMDHPRCAMAMLGRLSQRLHSRLGDLSRLSLKSADDRLVSWLVARLPEDAEEQCRIELEMPKALLASRLGILPETLSRALHRLGKRGLIRNSRGHIDVLDAPALRRLMHG